MSSLKKQFAATHSSGSEQDSPKTQKNDMTRRQSEAPKQLNIIVEKPEIKQSKVQLLAKAKLMNSNGNRLTHSDVKLEEVKETHRYLPITKEEA